MQCHSRILWSVAVVLSVVWITACDLRQMPGFRQAAKKQEEKITRETQEAIKNSATLQELDRVCTNEIPRPDGFVLVNQTRDFNSERYLGYGYHGDVDYQGVKAFYVNSLPQHGWQLTYEKDKGWGQAQVQFTKNPYRVTIFDLGTHEGANYSIGCEKL